MAIFLGSPKDGAEASAAGERRTAGGDEAEHAAKGGGGDTDAEAKTVRPEPKPYSLRP